MLKEFKHLIRKLALNGNNVYCCLCKRKYLTFLPSGDDIKAHSRCPGCDSIDRSRQLFTLVTQTINASQTPFRILHIAPEKQLIKRLSQLSLIEYICIDKFAPGYDYPKNVRNMDLTNLQFENNTFDLILCSHVLEHIPDDLKAMAEIRRVLKPEGKGFIIVPLFMELETTFENPEANTDDLRTKFFGQHDHVRKYGRDFPLRLQYAGFNTNCIDFNQQYSYEEKVRLGYLNAELIYEITKSS